MPGETDMLPSLATNILHLYLIISLIKDVNLLAPS